jgi:phenylpropionate dioxygenase-like ring-hydroxylating dioxygenase large terminal subunit
MTKAPLNFWYAIYESRKVKVKQLIQLKRLNQNLILWRSSEGEVICMENRCPHRGAELSLGCLKGDSVRCAYHGIQYNVNGDCIHIPAHGQGGAIPKGLQVKKYVIREAHGLVWFWWGEPKPVLPEIPWFQQVTATNYEQTGTIVYPISFIRLMESNFDGYHSEHIHGFKRGELVVNVKCETQGLLIKTQWENRRHADLPGVVTLLDTLFPSIMTAYCPNWKVGGIFTCVPIDDHNTWITTRYFGDAFRIPVLGRIKNWIFLQWALKWVFKQDVHVQRTQTPQETGYGVDLPVVNADRGIIAYWRLCKEFSEKEREQLKSMQEEVSPVCLSH